MSPEKDIVNLWLNRQGFLTISDINANNRVIDLVALKQGAEPVIRHVEIHCSVSSVTSILNDREKAELLKKFNDENVVSAVLRTIVSCLGREGRYEKFLVTTSNVSLPGVSVIRFQDVLKDVISQLDRQNYRSPIIRALQLVKFVLMGNPATITALVSREDSNKPLTQVNKERLLKELLLQDAALRLFSRKENEQLIVNILKSSTLKQPERLAAALESILTKRTATRFLNVLLQQNEVKTAIEEEISHDQKLARFLEA